MRDLVPPVAVTACDAGAANLIIGWLKDCGAMDVRVASDGPARSLFATELPQLPQMPAEEALRGAAVLLSGTSRLSLLEHESRKRARRIGVPSIGVVDHWVNYRRRFRRRGELLLPDAIWVADEFARSIAERCFPGLPVHQKRNRYLELLVSAIKTPPAAKGRALRILYVLEPCRSTWGRGEPSGEFQALEFFTSQLPRLGVGRNAVIRLRPHPTEPADKYARWIAKHRACNIALDDVRSLAAAISWADWVVGCETFAMVVALQAGRRVFSTLPPWGPRCRLPHAGIVRLREAAL
jgi:hypothetical protein